MRLPVFPRLSGLIDTKVSKIPEISKTAMIKGNLPLVQDSENTLVAVPFPSAGDGVGVATGALKEGKECWHQ